MSHIIFLQSGNFMAVLVKEGRNFIGALSE
jgi:hypothetical protein